ncbi:MAG: methylmalonyl-CoA mutase family protein [Actinomycetia bacterium]|nr:methylmalonyl-CoA mutase family protein [Actinomycetes bacterium]
MHRPYRVIVAKPGLDGHDRGARVVARALRDAGFEVIYLGLFQSPSSIAAVARDEDADGIGLSILSGAHGTLFPDVIDALRQAGLQHVLVFGGGVIPASDLDALHAAGVARVFTPGAQLGDITSWLAAALDERELAQRA